MEIVCVGVLVNNLIVCVGVLVNNQHRLLPKVIFLSSSVTTLYVECIVCLWWFVTVCGGV